jgi:preprotein translocase subunit Sec63
MTRKEWEQITKAAQLLGLKEQATIDEIKKAFRRLSKKHHPDLKKTAKQSAERIEMHKLTEAYQLLLEYCANYAFPLVPGEDEPLDGEDWWFERFGQDHHWGKGDGAKPKKRK